MKLQKTLILCVILMATPGHAMDRQRQLPSGGEVYCYDLINGLKAHKKEQACAQNKTEVYEAQKYVHRTRRKNVNDDLRYRINDLNQKINRAKAQEKACVQNEKKVYAAQKNVDDALSSLENLYLMESQFMESLVVTSKISDTLGDLTAAKGRTINQQEMNDLKVKVYNFTEEVWGLCQRLYPIEESEVNAIRKMPEGTVLEMEAKVESAIKLLLTKIDNSDRFNQSNEKDYHLMKSKKAGELDKALNTLAQQMIQKWNNGAFKCALQAKLERKNLEEQKSELVKIRRERANWTAIQAHDEAEKVCEQMNGEMMQMIQLQRQNLSLKEFAKWTKTDYEYAIKGKKCMHNLYSIEEWKAQQEAQPEAQKKVRMKIQKAEEEIDFTNKKIQEYEELVRQIDSLDQRITSSVTLLRQKTTRELTSEEVEELTKNKAMIRPSRDKVESLKSEFCNYIGKVESLKSESCNYIGKVDHTQKLTKQQDSELLAGQDSTNP